MRKWSDLGDGAGMNHLVEESSIVPITIRQCAIQKGGSKIQISVEIHRQSGKFTEHKCQN